MQNVLLRKEQIAELITENKYEIDQKNKFRSRCIDGRYVQHENLPALAIPGGDYGQLAIILSTARTYGFDVDLKKTIIALQEIVGGLNNIETCSDCMCIQQIIAHPEIYNILKEDFDDITSLLETIQDAGAKKHILQGEHREGAILLLEGDYGVYPQYSMHTDIGVMTAQTYIYHQSLAKERTKEIAKKLIELNAVQLSDSVDVEYLYTAFSETMEDLLFETLKNVAKATPIFRINFKSDGSYIMDDLGFA
ncbi:MAG: hypothetical protein WCO06_04645 [Candidatus Roizmanbacteria bacterium]